MWKKESSLWRSEQANPPKFYRFPHQGLNSVSQIRNSTAANFVIQTICLFRVCDVATGTPLQSERANKSTENDDLLENKETIKWVCDCWHSILLICLLAERREVSSD